MQAPCKHDDTYHDAARRAEICRDCEGVVDSDIQLAFESDDDTARETRE